MEQLKQIAFFIVMALSAVYTVIVIVALIFAAAGIGKIKKTKFDWGSLIVTIIWLSGLCLWLKYFNLI